jgi:hypothetical protein
MDAEPADTASKSDFAATRLQPSCPEPAILKLVLSQYNSLSHWRITELFNIWYSVANGGALAKWVD